MNINNLYNFKNTIKHFINIETMRLPNNLSTIDISSLSWVEPINFRVKKNTDKFRTLKIPNILNFVAAYEHFKNIPDIDNVQNLDPVHKRLSANVETGDFSVGEYDKQLKEDFEKLCVYDCLIKLDIKEYYGRIYTHKIDFQDYNENFLTNMNAGATNGLIMGNYLSLYFAELNLTYISEDIENEISNQGIECEFSYFSDDFYFFCNKGNIEKVVQIFDKVLEKYELERNEAKRELWSYETFNNYNLVARYWKKLIAYSNLKYDEERNDNKLYFINQIIYRLSKLADEKLKKVFINSFFKTKYFQKLPLEKYQIKDYDYHQLCFILKLSPEAMLYSINKFLEMESFDKNRLHRFFQVRYRDIVQIPFHEEQLYYYYAIKLLEFDDILIENKDLVVKSENQLLISYYLMDRFFDDENINYLKQFKDEKYWFQNYHLLFISFLL